MILGFKMNKENIRTAAGLRRSAIAERIRLREEWSALKEIDSQDSQPVRRQNNILTKKQNNVKAKKMTPVKEGNKTTGILTAGRLNRQSNKRVPSDALRGVVALVEVGSESRALPLRAALTALGASVMPAWSPLITHLVWAQGGCRNTRARARALASCLVSPLWVEACACASARLPERAFPAAARPSDLPSPTTLRQMLKKADAENLLFADLSDDKMPRLRLSSETERDTTADTTLDTSKDTTLDTSKDTSKNTTKDTSRDTSKDTSKETTTDIESRVNTVPRRALPKVSESVSPRPPAKSRRKLFTHRDDITDSDDEDENTQPRPTIPKPKLTKQTKAKPVKAMPSDRKELARAERMAKRFLAACTGNTLKTTSKKTPRIVLTGMCRNERREISTAILKLNGRLQKRVNKKTTHVILGSFQQERQERTEVTGITNLSQENLSRVIHRSDIQKARTVAALAGAARGARVLSTAWVVDSAVADKWVHEGGYEVLHLKKLSQKARVERAALRKLHCEYAYDVFCGMRVFVTKSAVQRDAAIDLLTLCGAVVQDGGIQHGGHQDGLKHGQGLTQLTELLGKSQKRVLSRTQHALVTQNGEIRYRVVENSDNDYDIKIGVENGEVCSKWVFDSVAAARMRTTRRYLISDLSNQASQVVQEMANFCLDDC